MVTNAGARTPTPTRLTLLDYAYNTVPTLTLTLNPNTTRCPHTHTSAYVSVYTKDEASRARRAHSSYHYICVLMLLYPHATIHVSSFYYICVGIYKGRSEPSASRSRRAAAAPIPAGTSLYVSSYMFPHTTLCVLMLLYMCPHTTMCPHTSMYVSYATICVLILCLCPMLLYVS